MSFTRTAIAIAVLALSASAGAQDQTQDQDQDHMRDQQMSQQRLQDQDIYGSHMMTREERDQHSNAMGNARTEQERERIWAEHHERMQARAKERGETLPEMPAHMPRQGAGGQGQGGGQGGGGGGGGGGNR